MSAAENVATLPEPRIGNYEFARFNALRHGVLSQYAVLPWEDGEEYRSLSRFQSPFPRSLVNAPCRCALIQINRRSTDGTSRPPKIW